MKVLIGFGLLAAAMLGVGCGGNGEKSAVANENSTSNGVKVVDVNSAQPTNTANPTTMPYNGAQNLNPNAFNGNNAQMKTIPYKPKEGELPLGTRNAPDDSTLTTISRGQEFVETRTFKNHPQLNKVEKIMDGKTNRYKVFLKNGKVLDGTEEKFANMASMAPISILEAVGIKPPAPSTPANVDLKK